MTLRILTGPDLERALSPRAALTAMRRAFVQLSSGRAAVPLRGALDSARGTTLLMPAWLPDAGELGAKIVSVFPRNADRGLPVVQGVVVLLDPETGAPRAVLDGTVLTGIRTAAGSALATELLADPDADVLAVFGAGAQGRWHIRLLAALRPLREVRVVSRSGRSAVRLADALSRPEAWPDGWAPAGGGPPRLVPMDDPEAAVRGAGIVVTATDSRAPVFDGRALRTGAHVNAVGSYRPDMREVDESVVLRARVVVDQRAAARAEAGELASPLSGGEGVAPIAAELGEIVAGDAPRGRDGHEVTLFKSVGNAAQDMAMAGEALAAAERRGLGVPLENPGA